MSDFFDKENVSMNVDEFRHRLDRAVQSVRELDADPGPGYDFSDMVETFTKWLEGEFEGLPPLGFIEAVRSHYTGMKQSLLLDEIPTLLHEAGLESATTTDGTKVTVKRDVSVSADDKQALYEWLKNHGYGDHVKTVLAFGKGEFTDDFRELLTEQGASFEEKEDVHYQTLAKIFRDRVEDGGELPPEQVAKINIFERARYK